MVNQQTLQGHWNEIKGKLRTKWGELAGDEFEAFDGNVDKLIGRIQRKTGEARSSIERYLSELTDEGASAAAGVAEDIREYVHHAAERIQEGSKEAVDSLRQGYEGAQEMVRRRPGESVVLCFGAGMIAGLLLGLFARRS